MVALRIASLIATVKPIQTQRPLRPPLVLLIFAVASSATGGLNTWTRRGPEGAEVQALALDPVVSGTAYVGTYSGVFTSADAGTNWTSASTGLPANSYPQVLAVDPLDHKTIYAGMPLPSGGKVFKSTTAGKDWEETSDFPIGFGSFSAIEIDSLGTIYVGTMPAGLFKSIDGGAQWVSIGVGLTSSRIRAIAADPSDPSTVYAVTADGVFKTRDSGGTWVAVNTGLTVTDCRSIAIARSTPPAIYVGTWGAGAFKSLDGGASWLPLSSVNDGAIRAIAADPFRPATLYAATGSSGVAKSYDGGATWTAISTGLIRSSNVAVLSVDPLVSGRVYAGTDVGVSVTETGGRSWSARDGGLIGTNIYALALDPTNSSTILAGTPGGVFKSTDGAGRWRASSSGLTNTLVTALAIDRAVPTVVYAGTAGAPGVAKSVDGGNTWTAAGSGLTNESVTALALDPVSSTLLYAATGDGVFRSEDGAAHWAPRSAGLTGEVYAIAVDPSQPSVLYAGTAAGIYKSTNSGAQWSASSSGLPGGPFGSVVIDPSSPAKVYAGGQAGVFMSVNGGSDWKSINSAAACCAWAFDLRIDPTDPTVLYYAGGSGVYKTADRGLSWVELNSGLTGVYVYALAVDATAPGALYAGTGGKGVADYETEGVSPAAAFSYLPLYPGPGIPVQFLDDSGHAAGQWLWTFGDPTSGLANTSTLQNPSHTFSTPGTYSVTLRVTNQSGVSEIGKTIAICGRCAHTVPFR